METTQELGIRLDAIAPRGLPSVWCAFFGHRLAIKFERFRERSTDYSLSVRCRWCGSGIRITAPWLIESGTHITVFYGTEVTRKEVSYP